LWGICTPSDCINSAGLSYPIVSTDSVNRSSEHPRFRIYLELKAYQSEHFAKSCIMPRLYPSGSSSAFTLPKGSGVVVGVISKVFPIPAVHYFHYNILSTNVKGYL